MEILIQDVNWIAVAVGAVLAYALGWLWYSPTLFGTKWAAGVGINTSDGSGPMGKAMLAQAAGTLLLAWFIGLAVSWDVLILAVFAVVTFAALNKAGGLFTQKSMYAIVVDAGYLFAMAAIMIAVQLLM